MSLAAVLRPLDGSVAAETQASNLSSGMMRDAERNCSHDCRCHDRVSDGFARFEFRNPVGHGFLPLRFGVVFGAKTRIAAVRAFFAGDTVPGQKPDEPERAGTVQNQHDEVEGTHPPKLPHPGLTAKRKAGIA